MSFTSWLHNLRSAYAPDLGARAARPGRRGVRLGLEQLEDRTVPASFTAATVPDLIADINAANLNAEADTITLAANKTFTLTAVNNTTHGDTGLPVITGSENLTIIGNGDIIERSTTSAPAFRLLDVAAGASLTLSNLTLQGGDAEPVWDAMLQGGDGTQFGGAVFNQGTLILNSVTVQNNGAAFGGGIASSGTLSLNGSTVQNNVAHGLRELDYYSGAYEALSPAQGGGIYASGTLTMTGGTIQNNQAVGGVYCDCYSTYDSSYYFNYEGMGGGLYLAGGVASLLGVTVDGNIAQGAPGSTYGANGYGGGLYVAGGTVSLSVVTLFSNTAQGGNGEDSRRFAGGSGGYGLGGGLYAAGGTVTLLNSTVTSNTAKGGTGGHGHPNGKAGAGNGGGLYINAAALVYLDAYTLAHIKNNHANNYANLFGSWVAW